MSTAQTSYKVSIRCLVYNHARYLRDCLEGIVSQKTDFPFEAIVHDDASTDGSADIIREYAAKYPHIIKPILQKKNLYQSVDKHLIGNSITEACTGRYWALCEGDDYWTDTKKLQKQVDFLDNHPEYSMVCTDGDVLTPEGMEHWYRYPESCDVPFSDIVSEGGLWIHTASIMYRPELLNPYPDFCRNCHVGDYPLQILMGVRGKVYFIAERMVVYRFMNPTSWTKKNSIPNISRYPQYLSEIKMLQGMNQLTEGKYCDLFYKRIASYSLITAKRCHSLAKLFIKEIPEIPLYLNKKDRRDFWKIRWGLKGLNRKIKAFFLRKK